jgi:cold shock CspA family protein
MGVDGLSTEAAPTAGVPLGDATGTVESFDDPRGLGVVRGDAGHGYPFHCANIADGTRTIAEGTAVTFRVAAGRQGRWEAVDVRPVPGAG